ncbi:cellulose binding domain-containing protein [Jidongwangia harbinensis]|uniref:cellulose binding domain-containing protein n=1 Tax=Jidongwangia harbinensis TaxID=2878561 RepID=UPI001CD9B0EB|nr:cellulose binding domain-containing protein [Jidongwangia harbinensis]MCA2211715.1 cellulose-binding domain-containing protein [Jidongwangia harbinensis]
MSVPSPSRTGVGRLLIGVLVAAGVLAAPVPALADDQAISVNFAAATTAPTYRASGWIYGMTENGANPPDRFFTDIKFRAMRAGGAQLPGGGWQGGGYDRRWNATRAQMLRTQALGGTFVLLPHDLWGADGARIGRYPGDNGDWTDYHTFLTRVIADVKATGVPVQWDIWNEPNISIFWDRPQSQYFELWRRTYQRLRADLPGTLIVGPSHAGVPSTANGSWWTQYLDYVKANNAVPDIFSWHALPSDPVANVAAADATLDARGIPHPRPYQINEYGAANEQNPADGAWYLTRLERAGADGLRANWASGGNLHNDLGNLLTHDSAGQYQTKGEWWVYQFYAGQTGTAVTTTPSGSYDGYATRDIGVGKVLVGGGRTTGNLTVSLRALDSTAGIIADNRVRVLVQRIPHNNGGAVSSPATVQDQVTTLNGNATTVTIANNAVNDAYTITLLPPSTPSPPPSGPPVPETACATSYRVANSWPGGHQAEVRVANTGTASITGWRVSWTMGSGQSISQVWNGSLTTSGTTATVTNATHNGAIPPGGGATFGLLGSDSPSTTPTLTCTAT